MYDYVVVRMKYGLILWVSQTRLITDESVLHLLIVGPNYRMMRFMDNNDIMSVSGQLHRF